MAPALPDGAAVWPSGGGVRTGEVRVEPQKLRAAVSGRVVGYAKAGRLHPRVPVASVDRRGRRAVPEVWAGVGVVADCSEPADHRRERQRAAMLA